MNGMPKSIILRCVRSYRILNRHLWKKSLCTSTRKIADIPRPRELPIIGTLFSLLLAGGPEKLHEYIDRRHKQLGPIFQECMGSVESIFICEPELIRQVFANEGKYPKHALPESWLLYNEIRKNSRGLYFMDGQEWLEHRKILNHILAKYDNQSGNVEETYFLEELIKNWLHDSKHVGAVVNLEDRLYVLSITCKSWKLMFVTGIRIAGENYLVNHFYFMMYYIFGTPFVEYRSLFLHRIQKLAVVVREIFEYSVKLSSIPARLAKICNLNSWSHFVDAVDQSIMISCDLLDDMCRYTNHNGILHDMLDAKIPIKMIYRIAIDFIIAAGDTTATLTQWVLYLLGKNEGIQERLFLGIKSGQNDRERLLKNIVRETSRLYPVAPFIARYLPCKTEITIPGGGPTYLLEANQLISLSMYTSGRDDRNFPDANSFNPDRWQRREINKSQTYIGVNNVYGSLPFAMGSRSCIGRKLAENQLYLTIKTITLSYRIETINTVGIKLNLISVPSQPIKLRLQKRN